MHVKSPVIFYGAVLQMAGYRSHKPEMLVRVQPVPPRRKKSAPFRFRGLRKSRESSTSAGPFFLFRIEPAALGFDSEQRY